MHQLCNLCGVLLVPCRPSLLGDPPKRLEWKHEVRAITSQKGWPSPSLTGVGYLDDGALMACSDPDVSYTNPQHDPTRHYLHYSSPAPEIWTFAFHEACWQILLQKVSLSVDRQPQPQRVAELLFRLLHCLPYDRFHVPCPTHDFGGALRFRDSPLELPESWNFLLADPTTFDYDLATSWASNVSESIQNPPDFLGFTDIFARLSAEIIQLIANFLDSPDLCNLRLSSKFVAKLSEPNQLSQDFWKSRFTVDREMGFFPIENERSFRLTSKTDWRKLYFDIKFTLRDKSKTGHIRNRRRIWLCLDHLAYLLSPLLDQKLRLQDGQTIELDENVQPYEPTQIVEVPTIQDSRGLSGLGARLFGFQNVVFSSQSRTMESRIPLSRMLFDNTYYICGMRVCEQREMDDIMEVSRVGYIIPESEVHVPVAINHRLTAMQVAASASGIVGLGFRIENGTDPVAWKNVGVVTDPPEGVGIATLLPNNGSQICGAIVGLDACKFISFQILEQGIAKAKAQDPAALLSWLWHPSEPDTTRRGVALPSTPKQRRASNPIFLLNMDFGGLGGVLLPHLNRITALNDERYGYFKGFAFSYIDGQTKTFGITKSTDTANQRYTCIEQSLSIDGPGGERVVSLQYEPDTASETENLQVIKLGTNSGRTLEFRQMRRPTDEAQQGQKIISPTATVISALLAKVKMSSGAIQSLGMNCVASKSPISSKLIQKLFAQPNTVKKDPYIFPYSKAAMAKAPRSIRGIVGCFTSVMLSDIRRVGISIGQPGKTREISHVSGLCFEFWGSSHPVYMGQWHHEVGHLSLTQGQRIQSFTFWQQQETRPNNTQRENSGRITGVKITRTGAGYRDIEVVLGDKKDMLSYSFIENPYERLTGLAWAFNGDCDYIYTLIKPSDHYAGTSLTLRGMISIWPNSRAPGKLTWQIEGDMHNLYNVTRIHAVFCRGSGKLSGFVFDYGDGQLSRYAGSIDGVKSSMDLGDGERINRMDLLLRKDKDEVVFSTTTGRVHALSASGAYDEPKHQEPSDFEVFKFSHAGSDSDSSQISSNKGPGTSDECVGIWLTMGWWPRATNNVEAVGPILSTKGNE